MEGLDDDQRPLIDVFRPGATFEHPTFGILRPRVVDVGELAITGRHIGACDPLTTDMSAFFAREVAPGRYRVEIAYALVDTTPKMLAARVLVRPHVAIASVAPASFFGASAEGIAYQTTGVGSFFDATAHAILDDTKATAFLSEKFAATDSVDSPPLSISSPGHPEKMWAFRSRSHVDAESPQVVASYWGNGDDGEAVCVWTDFGLLHAPDFQRIPLPSPLDFGSLSHPLLSACGLSFKVGRFPRRVVVSGPAGAVQTLRLVAAGSGAVPTAKLKLVGTNATRSFPLLLKSESLTLEVLMGERPLTATF